LIVALAIGGLITAARPSAEKQRCFDDSSGRRVCLSGRFLAFWEQQGGAAVFGLPVSSPMTQAAAKGTLTVQYFERARFELHPRNPAPYDVMLGRIGSEWLQTSGHPTAKDLEATATTDCRSFGATGYRVCGRFLQFWRAHGLRLDGNRVVSEAESLALLGLPITTQRSETGVSGRAVVGQWFERAHLQQQNDGSVVMTPLGREVAQVVLQGPVGPSQAVTPTFVPTSTATVPAGQPTRTPGIIATPIQGITATPGQGVTATPASGVIGTQTPSPTVTSAPTTALEPIATASPTPTVPRPTQASAPQPPATINVARPGVPCDRNVPPPANGLQLWVTDPNDNDNDDQMTACVRLIVANEAASGAGAVIYRHYGDDTRPTIYQSTGQDGWASFIFYTGAGSPGVPSSLEAVVSFRGVTYRSALQLR
jgi:hypothetical protein